MKDAALTKDRVALVYFNFLWVILMNAYLKKKKFKKETITW